MRSRVRVGVPERTRDAAGQGAGSVRQNRRLPEARSPRTISPSHAGAGFRFPPGKTPTRGPARRRARGCEVTNKERYEVPRLEQVAIDPATFAGAYGVELPLPGGNPLPDRLVIDRRNL